MERIARTPRQMGEAVRFQRRKLKLTQSQVSEKTHLRQGTISMVEAGDPGTQLRTFCDVLAALDLELVIRLRTQVPQSLLEEIF